MDPRKKMMIEKKNERAKEIVKQLREIMATNNIPHLTVAKEIGVARSTITEWLRESKFPSENALKKIELFISNHSAPLPPLHWLLKELQLYMKDSGDTLEEVAAKIGVTHPTIIRWLEGRVFPNQDNMRKIIDFFDSL